MVRPEVIARRALRRRQVVGGAPGLVTATVGLSWVADDGEVVGHVRVARLRAHGPWMTGTLVYPEAFWRHDAVGLREPGA